MFQFIANCWRGQAQLSNAIVTEFPVQCFRGSLGLAWLGLVRRRVRVRKGARHCRRRACPEPPADFAGPGGARLPRGLRVLLSELGLVLLNQPAL